MSDSSESNPTVERLMSETDRRARTRRIRQWTSGAAIAAVVVALVASAYLARGGDPPTQVTAAADQASSADQQPNADSPSSIGPTATATTATSTTSATPTTLGTIAPQTTAAPPTIEPPSTTPPTVQPSVTAPPQIIVRRGGWSSYDVDVTGRVLTFYPSCTLSGLETFDRVEVQEAPSHAIVDIYVRVDTANGATCPHVAPWGPIVVELAAPLGPLGVFQSSNPIPHPPPPDPA